MIGLVILILTAGDSLKTYNMDTVVVTGSRMPLKFSELTRAVTVIRDLSGNSISEVLKSGLSVDAMNRGPLGVQTDLGIRGSTFSQALVLVNGIKINDPQTEHHNMDIPIALSDIKQVEILGGGASAVYGANAFGGVVNILTKAPSKEFYSKFGTSYGSWNTQLSNANVEFNNLGLYFESKSSDGYIEENTDYNNKTFGGRVLIKGVELFSNYMDKKFGAAYFYHDANAREETGTLFSGIKANTGMLNSNLYHRMHRDKYTVDATNPVSIANEHTVNTVGLESQVSLKSFVFGCEGIRDYVASNVLDDHTVDKLGIFGQWQAEIKELTISSGLRGDYNSLYEWEASPNLGMAYNLNPGCKLRASVGRAFRVPSFTELYYEGGASKGNPNLKPEEAWNYDAGTDYFCNGVSFINSVFIRDGKNIIDWPKDSLTNLYTAQNIMSDRVIGAEVGIRAGLAYINYTYMWAKNVETLEYIRSRPKHLLSGGVKFEVRRIGVSLDGLYKERQAAERVRGESYYFVFNGRLERGIRINDFIRGKLFVQGTNLFDEEYKEYDVIPMPGRGVEFGLVLETTS